MPAREVSQGTNVLAAFSFFSRAEGFCKPVSNELCLLPVFQEVCILKPVTLSRVHLTLML